MDALACRILAIVGAMVLAFAVVSTASTPAASGRIVVTVDTTQDSYDGSCEDGDCSLRDAVKSTPPGGRVLVPPGFYPLSRTGVGGVGEGSIDVNRGIEIAGEGESGAFVDASDLGEAAFTVSPRRDGARVTIAHLTIFGTQSVAASAGGALHVQGGSVRLVGATVTGGLAGRGGGIAIEAAGELAVVDSLVLGNDAETKGGGIWNQGSLSVAGSTVSGNFAADGGGLGSSNGSVTALERSTIAENIATTDGGGAFLSGGGEIVGTTIANNQAARGGGISLDDVVTIERSIVADNTADRAPQCHGTLSSRGDNVGSGRRCGLDAPGDLRETDPRLRRLGLNGGPTLTMALAEGSLAVGIAGDCGGRDQRGAPRDRRCDAGAYEIVRCLGEPANIVGTPGEDELSGGRGADVFIGLGGDDEFQGSIGEDRACGGPGDDLLIAGPGPDRFDGGVGDDRVRGESGDDRVWGGAGRDRLVGGPGRDVCQLEPRDLDTSGCERLVSAGGAA